MIALTPPIPRRRRSVALLGKRLSERIQELRSACPAMAWRAHDPEGHADRAGAGDDPGGYPGHHREGAGSKQPGERRPVSEAGAGEPEGRLVGAKAKLLDYQAFDFDMQAITRELQALYPQVQSCSMGRHRIWSETTQQVENRVMATLDLPAPLSAEEKTRVETWLAARAGVQAVTIVRKHRPRRE
ncbi:MAG: hypothetical protein ACLU9S_04175 [Oscillospiraceae bacterium]